MIPHDTTTAAGDSRRVLDAAPVPRGDRDVLHVHDWIAGLAALPIGDVQKHERVQFTLAFERVPLVPAHSLRLVRVRLLKVRAPVPRGVLFGMCGQDCLPVRGGGQMPRSVERHHLPIYRGGWNPRACALVELNSKGAHASARNRGDDRRWGASIVERIPPSRSVWDAAHQREPLAAIASRTRASRTSPGSSGQRARRHARAASDGAGACPSACGAAPPSQVPPGFGDEFEGVRIVDPKAGDSSPLTLAIPDAASSPAFPPSASLFGRSALCFSPLVVVPPGVTECLRMSFSVTCAVPVAAAAAASCPGTGGRAESPSSMSTCATCAQRSNVNAAEWCRANVWRAFGCALRETQVIAVWRSAWKSNISPTSSRYGMSAAGPGTARPAGPVRN